MSLYELLGVSKDATPVELKKAYRKCTQLYHKEKGIFSVDARIDNLKKRYGEEVIFALIQQAYTILSNPEKRMIYDAGKEIPDLDYKLLNQVYGSLSKKVR